MLQKRIKYLDRASKVLVGIQTGNGGGAVSRETMKENKSGHARIAMPQREQLDMFSDAPLVDVGPSLSDARDALFAKFEDGSICPCCDQFVKLYKRGISGEMAHALILMRRFGDGSFINLPRFMQEHKAGRSNMTSLLRLWGLIEQQKGSRGDGSWRTGYYRITPKGIAFVDGKSSVEKYVYIYNQKVVEVDDPDMSKVTILEALGAKFDYQKLMNGES